MKINLDIDDNAAELLMRMWAHEPTLYYNTNHHDTRQIMAILSGLGLVTIRTLATDRDMIYYAADITAVGRQIGRKIKENQDEGTL